MNKSSTFLSNILGSKHCMMTSKYLFDKIKFEKKFEKPKTTSFLNVAALRFNLPVSNNSKKTETPLDVSNSPPEEIVIDKAINSPIANDETIEPVRENVKKPERPSNGFNPIVEYLNDFGTFIENNHLDIIDQNEEPPNPATSETKSLLSDIIKDEEEDSKIIVIRDEETVVASSSLQSYDKINEDY